MKSLIALILALSSFAAHASTPVYSYAQIQGLVDKGQIQSRNIYEVSPEDFKALVPNPVPVTQVADLTMVPQIVICGVVVTGFAMCGLGIKRMYDWVQSKSNKK